MPEARDITQRIAGWLKAGTVPAEAQAAATAEAYAWLTRRAAQRLNRCAALLAQGLRSEAVQEADAEPALLEELASLELPDGSAWAEMCRRRGWPLPEGIRPDVAALLNRAYADEALVEPLLREYRLRCVVRAPIKARLAALRALAGVDRGNRPWHDALVELEQARLAEIRQEVRDALGDVATLQELRRELGDDRQKLAPPRDLVRLVDDALQDGRVMRAQQRLEAILPSLEHAYSAMDYQACARGLEDWTQTLKAVGRSALHVPEPIKHRVEPIVQWVERQAQVQAADVRFRAACERLAAELRQAAPGPGLRLALDEASSFERPLPGTLGRDAKEALRLQALGVRRRRRIKRAAGALAAAFALAGIGGWLLDRRQTQVAEGRIAEVQEALDAGRVSEAEVALTSFVADYPARRAEAAVREALAALQQQQDAARARAASFAAWREAIDAMPESAWTPASFEAAQAWVQSDTEREAWQARRSRLDVLERERDAAANREALAALAERRALLGMWDAGAIEADPEAARGVAMAVMRASEVGPGASRLPASTVALLGALVDRAENVAETADAVLQRQRREAGELAAVEAMWLMADRPAELAAELRRFVERYPDSPRSSDFARAGALEPAWAGVEAWHVLRQRWARADPADRREAAERLRQIDAFRQAHPGSVFDAEVSSYAAYWGAGLLASAPDGPWMQRLPELMRAPAFRDLGVVQTTDGRRFYVVGDAERRETSLGTSVKVALTPDLTRLTAMNFPRGVLGPVQLSPQASLANALLEEVGAFSFVSWESFAVDVVETVYRHDEVDAVLRGLLLGLVLDAYASSVGAMDSELEALRSRLALHRDDTANWMNPEDLAAQRAREALAGVLGDPPDFSGMRTRAAERREAVAWGVSTGVVGHAVRLSDGDGLPMLGGVSVRSGGSRWLYGVTASEPRRWQRVGQRADGGELTWRPAAAQVPAGSVLWWVSDERAGAGSRP